MPLESALNEALERHRMRSIHLMGEEGATYIFVLTRRNFTVTFMLKKYFPLFYSRTRVLGGKDYRIHAFYLTIAYLLSVCR